MAKRNQEGANTGRQKNNGSNGANTGTSNNHRNNENAKSNSQTTNCR